MGRDTGGFWVLVVLYFFLTWSSYMVVCFLIMHYVVHISFIHFSISMLYFKFLFKFLKNLHRFRNFSGLPWWRSGWESACQCRGHGFKPWSGKIPHAAEQLGSWATITEPARLEPVLHNERGRDSERRGPRTAMKSGPRLPQLEKALAQKRRPNTAINK